MIRSAVPTSFPNRPSDSASRGRSPSSIRAAAAVSERLRAGAYTAFAGRGWAASKTDSSAGGTGSAALQLGRALGARVLATAGGPEKAAFCRALGADLVIDYRNEDLAARVREATGGRGAEVVYDPVGGEAFEAATRAIAHEGRLLVVGFASGRWGVPQCAHLVERNYSLLGVMPGGYDRAFRQQAQDALCALWRAGALRVPVARTLPFEALPQGLESLARGEVSGRLVLGLS